jgi:hypothetical protein
VIYLFGLREENVLVRAIVLRGVGKVASLRRDRPSNSLKDKCREAAMESLGEASQVGERANDSREETFSHPMDLRREERMAEIL